MWSVAELKAALVCRRLLEGSTGGEGGTKSSQLCLIITHFHHFYPGRQHIINLIVLNDSEISLEDVHIEYLKSQTGK